jgi:hypothetical protein
MPIRPSDRHRYPKDWKSIRKRILERAGHGCECCGIENGAIGTGNGAHAWWLFKEPLVFDSGEERNAAADLVARWQTLLRLNAASRGWAFDRLSDLARVLRIPGTLNNKDPQNPKPVSIYSNAGRRYNPSDFAEFLDDAAIPSPAERAETTTTQPVILPEPPADEGLPDEGKPGAIVATTQ